MAHGASSTPTTVEVTLELALAAVREFVAERGLPWNDETIVSVAEQAMRDPFASFMRLHDLLDVVRQ